MRSSGLRAPAYENEIWFAYWKWLGNVVVGGLFIRDFNADPERNKQKDRVLLELASAGGWDLDRPEGEWSFLGRKNGWRLDHVLARNRARVLSASHVAEPFVPGLHRSRRAHGPDRHGQVAGVQSQ